MSEQPPSGPPAGDGWPAPAAEPAAPAPPVDGGAPPPTAQYPAAPPPGRAPGPGGEPPGYAPGGAPGYAPGGAPGYGPGYAPGGYGVEPVAYPGYPPGPPPYAGAAIHAPSAAAPEPQRSTAASVLGTLGIIFGSLITLGGALHLGCRALVSSLQVPAAKDPEIMRLLQLEMGIWGVMTLMSIGLIVVGIGVWRHREVARKAMLVWSILALAVIAGRMATQALLIQPYAAHQQRELMERQGGMNPNAEKVLQVGKAWAVFGDLVIWAPYPILALILLSRPRVRDRCS